MRLRNLLPTLLLIPAFSAAQDNVQLDFGSPGEREIWISDRIALPPATLKTADAKLTLPKQGGPKDRIYVWDRKSGNVASRGTAEIKGVWTVKPEDFKLAGKVTVRVEHEGEPVAFAFVKLKDSGGERDSQIDAGKKGEATFFGVRPGNLQVTVRYVSNGVDADPVVQPFVLELDRPSADTLISVSLTKPVETVGTPKQPVKGEGGTESGDQPPPKQAPRGSFIGNVLVYLLGLAVAIAAIYFGLKYAKENQSKVKAQLEKVGVQIPDPQDTPIDAAPATPIAPAPPQKILLDDAAPLASDPPVPVTVFTEPSLVMENGDAFPIPEGETSIGREAGNALALVAESTVSRRHATLVRSGATVTIRDEGSSNGTYVNGVKIASETQLNPGDQVQFGEARFRFEA